MRLQVRVSVVLMVILNKLVFHIKFQTYTRPFQFQADHKNGLEHVWVGGQWRIIFSPISISITPFPKPLGPFVFQNSDFLGGGVFTEVTCNINISSGVWANTA